MITSFQRLSRIGSLPYETYGIHVRCANLWEVQPNCLNLRSYKVQVAKEHVKYSMVVWVCNDIKYMIIPYLIDDINYNWVMLLFTWCMILTLSLDWLVVWAHVRQTFHNFDITLRFCISSSFKNIVCMLVRYSTK